jgi:uncharacterized protein YgiM (DUF1202 family)
MKKHCWLTLGLMVATVAVAQNNSNTLPAIPSPVTSPMAESVVAPAAAPAVAPVKQKPKTRAAAPAKVVKLKEPTVALVPGAAEVTVSNLIVRGQAGLQGEVVTHLFKGDAVTVLSQINLDKHAADEPAQWAKIALPSTVHVWLNGKFIDATSKAVSAKKLNLRAGPGENYSVVGLLEKGATVSEVETKGDWIKIEAPTNAFAFVAAMYLKQEAAAPVATNLPPPVEIAPTPAPTPTPVPEPQPIVTEPAPAPVATENNPPPAVAPPVSVPAPEPVVIETNVPTTPRVATHEGVVRHVGSLITPTEYELYDPTTDNNVDFLYTTTTNLNLGRYVGMRIIVTGKEGLAARWNDIPVLTIERILVIDTNAVPQIIYRSPRSAGQRH